MGDRNPIPALFSEAEKLRRWTEIEVLAVQSHVSDEWRDLLSRSLPALVPTQEEVAVREGQIDHDVAAFVDCLQDRVRKVCGPVLASCIHQGLTSSDIVDTATCWTLRDGIAQIMRANGDDDTHWDRLRRVHRVISVGKLSGAVGNYSNIEPEVEAYVLQRLELRPVPSTQIIGRDRHAEVVFACALLAPRQLGHWVSVALENVALWHERDISHSAVERIMFPEVLSVAWEAAAGV